MRQGAAPSLKPLDTHTHTHTYTHIHTHIHTHTHTHTRARRRRFRPQACTHGPDMRATGRKQAGGSACGEDTARRRHRCVFIHSWAGAVRSVANWEPQLVGRLLCLRRPFHGSESAWPHQNTRRGCCSCRGGHLDGPPSKHGGVVPAAVRIVGRGAPLASLASLARRREVAPHNGLPLKASYGISLCEGFPSPLAPPGAAAPRRRRAESRRLTAGWLGPRLGLRPDSGSG